MKESVPDNSASWRFYVVLTALSCLGLLLVWRVVTLQVVEGIDRGFEFLQGEGKARTVRRETIPAHRGMIADRFGVPIAVSTPVTSIWANPRQLIQQSAQLASLAQALDLPYGQLKKKLSDYRNKGFVYLRRHMAPSEADKILALGVFGVYGEREYRRFYPAGEVVAHLLGFTDIEDHGQEGLELAYEDWLKGVPGQKRVLKDLHGRVIKDIQLMSSAIPGNNLDLSIDLRLQHLAYRELKTAIRKHRAKSGSVVLLDVKTGEVLAMVNQPSYNPNNRRNLKAAKVRNRALTDVFEPGSTVKPFTIIAALESGQYTPKTLIDTNPGYIKVGSKTLLDPVNYGVIDVTKVITKSSQVGISKIALSLDEQAVYDVFFRLGLGQDTGSGFPGESSGILPNYSRWKDIDRVTFAFGHGLSVTTLQLARAYAVLANAGIKRDISLLKIVQASHSERVLKAETAKAILAMLRTVTQKGGTATRAQVDAYTVAGKTGTTHKVGRNGYEDSRYVSIFAGLAPASKPRIVAVVMVDEPKGNEYYGGEIAAPIFSKVVAGALRLMNVAPDDRALLSASYERLPRSSG